MLPSRANLGGQGSPCRLRDLGRSRPALRKLVPILAIALALGAADDKVPATGSVDREAEALAFVREHHPELASVLEPLKAMNPSEFRKAISELSQVARNQAELKLRNPKRHELALDVWKTKSRVELLAAQLAGSPANEEIRSQLRLAIEAKVDADLRRQKDDLAQAEAVARKLRQSIDRLENRRDETVEARFRALQPKKPKTRKKAEAAPSAAGRPEERP